MKDKSGCTNKVGMERRSFLKKGLLATAATGCGIASLANDSGQKTIDTDPTKEKSIRVKGVAYLDKALQICTKVYPVNRRKDMLSFTNKTGYRMTVSPNGYPVAICMSPDLTFGMLGSRFVENRDYLDTFRGHLDHLPRNMRRNGKFFINEDLLSGADRVFTQVMYPIWIWELYLATGDMEVLKFHHKPLLRCLSYIESRTSSEGIVNQVDPDDWQVSEGADWVDWCPERMEGSTCVYHTWYVHALKFCVNIFHTLGDVESEKMCLVRKERQLGVLNNSFWNGSQYWDNLNFQGEKVGRFWCDSQIWPIAYGFSSQNKASAIFRRIDAEPEVFEGVPMRWCAPIEPGDEDPRYAPDGKYGDMIRSFLRDLSWFGRLGSGDILARYRTDQVDHALKLILRFGEIVARMGTVTESLDMTGNLHFGTGGEGDYLEHAGGYLWCVGKGMMGVDDTVDGSLVWTPQIPESIKQASTPYWHKGVCWTFGCDEETLWIDSQGAKEDLVVVLNGEKKKVVVNGEIVRFSRNA